MDSSVGVAVVGTGFGQKVHIPALLEHPKVQIRAIYHRELEKARAIAQAYEVPHAHDSIEDLVALPDVQAFAISTPPFLHYDMAKAVLQSGKHLLLEKPTTLKAEEARDLYHLANQTGSIVTLNFEFRCVPAWQWLAEQLAEGYVGQKRLIKVDWMVSSRADANRHWNWYAQKHQGGGALGAIGSHAFDYIAWLFGPIHRLCARLSTTIPARPDPHTREMKPVDADDTCLLILELADGTPCHICLSAVTYQGRGHWLEVYGDRGTLIVGNDNQQDYIHGFRVLGSEAGKTLAEIPVPDRLAFPRTFMDGRIAPVLGIVNRWVDGIQQGKVEIPSLREGVYSQLLMDLAHQSSLTGAWVDVPDLDDFLHGTV
ncbi:MAG: Gfo/Idh/MocA family oxidoreductase [Leptolyngbyaceae cyanobacterium bins.59]|nr:Gfo/Idh/MocA family oxidoreductase [Leptolyngbyaceae cyanobacterium bins.59]